MAWLLIDNSNTRTKFALGDGDGLLEWRAILPTCELTADRLKELLAEFNFTNAVFASVVPEKAEVLRSFLRPRCDHHSVDFRSPLGYGFDVPHPEQIGNDRLANVAALVPKYGGPAIVIDFGTAVTFSVLSAEGDFAGGVIAPGMGMMTEYLASRTAQLPSVSPAGTPSAIGKTTVEAMEAGAVFGHRGMVREILTELRREIKGEPEVIATGGGAAFFAAGCPEIIHQVEPDLTLEGLRLIGKDLFQQHA